MLANAKQVISKYSFIRRAVISRRRRIAVNRQPGSNSFPDINPKNFAAIVINAGINAGTQYTAVSQRLSVCRRRVKIVHLELLSVYRDDVAFAVAGVGLLMKNLNRPFDNLIL